MPVPAAAIAKPIPLGARPAEAACTVVRCHRRRHRRRSRCAPTRITRVRGDEAYPSWAPDNQRVAFYAVRDGVGSVWVATVEPPRPEADRGSDAARRSRRRRRSWCRAAAARRRGRPMAGRCWSPGLPDPEPVYNGNPLRNEAERAAAVRAERARSSCGACRRRCRCTKTAARVPAELAPSPALFARGVRSRLDDA